mmetsp:Transcript_46965/g.116297  ORF Transcript_46965/g.116297 Transcript_46965/m.116297 type:complete len:113 (-) Transcript_46965:288-626(-)
MVGTQEVRMAEAGTEEGNKAAAAREAETTAEVEKVVGMQVTEATVALVTSAAMTGLVAAEMAMQAAVKVTEVMAVEWTVEVARVEVNAAEMKAGGREGQVLAVGESEGRAAE